MKSKFIKPVIVLFTIFIVSFVQVKQVEAQNVFYGKMKFKSQTLNGKPSYTTYYNKEEKFRVDNRGPNIKTSIISNGKTTDMVNYTSKVYIEYHEGIYKFVTSMFSSTDTSDEIRPANWKEILKNAESGKIKTILGHECKEFVMSNNNGGSRHVWAATDLKNLTFIKGMSHNPFLKQMNNMFGPYFPMLSEKLNADGKVVYKFEVIEMKQGKVDENLFEPPAGFKKINIPGMK